MTPEQTKGLRAPFPDSVIGKLPRVTCKDCDTRKACNAHKREKCPHCNNFITTAHIHLDYVGHAAVTDRLLQVDPDWTWEPLAVDDLGVPVIKDGVLWIKLTVCGLTRLGVGDAPGKSGTGAIKELIGDAIRNAAMRFGVGLDLWSKEDLHAAQQAVAADPDVIAELVDRMDAIADETLRKKCKLMYRTAFGMPEELTEANIVDASKLIAGWEAAQEALSAVDDPATGVPPSEDPGAPETGEEPAQRPSLDEAMAAAPVLATEGSPASPWTVERVLAMSKPDLVGALRDLGLPTSGNIATLRDRLVGQVA